MCHYNPRLPFLLFASALSLRSTVCAAGPSSLPAPNMTFLDNGEVRIGMDLALGCAVTFISSKDHPGNIINSADLVRQIQMSHYSGPWPFEVGSKKPNPAWAGLGWNPIQTGDCYLNPSKVLEHRNSEKELYVMCIPTLWPMNDVPGECIFETWTPADGRPFHTWGIMPYEKGDHQIDALFRELYPGYEDASYYRDERGFLTATPWGDSFDVLMSNTPRFVLNRYNAALIIGPTKIEGQLLQTVEDFAARGGSVATTAAQLTSESAALFGVRLTGKTVTDRYAKLSSGLGFSEASFTRHVLEPLEGAEVLAKNYRGELLAILRRTPQGGEMLVFAADFGLSDEVAKRPSVAAENVPIVPSHLMLQHVKSILMPWMARWNLLEVEGPPVQFLTNLTDTPDKFVLTLCNNSPFAWKGTVRLKGARIVSGSNWMTDGKIAPCEALHLEINPFDVVVVDVRVDKPLVVFGKDEGPEPTPAELERKSAALFARLAG